MLLQTLHTDPSPPDQESDIALDIDRLALTHGRAVYHAAYRVLGDPALAEDVQQGVFLRLLEKPPRQVIDRWGAYLCAMATRSAIDELRRRHRRQRLSLLFGVGGEATEPPPAEVAEQSARATMLREAIGQLPRRQAQCFALRFFDGLSLDEIARTLALTNNAVSVSLNRATRSLRRHVEALETSRPNERTDSGEQENSQ